MKDILNKMAKHNWNVTAQNHGQSTWVSNGYHEIFIGARKNGTKEQKNTVKTIAHIICDALNKNNPYKKTVSITEINQQIAKEINEQHNTSK